jgi:5-formyltetrahydrofolate cyclo-ligase
MSPASKPALRRSLRAARRQLSRRQQRLASDGLVKRFRGTPHLLRARSVALYYANDGELNPALLARWLWSSGKSVYLPVLHPRHEGELLFVPWQPDTLLSRNRFGIPEPVTTRSTIRPAWTLDLILTPLVGFDREGRRLGMGGGFYDRTLARMQRRPQPRKPGLWGIAHDCQEMEHLPCEPWDIPLDGVITGTRVLENPGGRQAPV